MSKTKLRNASYSIKKLMDKSTLSFQTRHNYQDMLKLCTVDMDALGYKIDHIRSLKQKHVYALVAHWQGKGVGVATIKNRLSAIRHACELLGKYRLMESNEVYGIGKREYISRESKAIHEIDFSKISDPYIRLSLKLQQLFGLRREESIKFIATIADKGDRIVLEGSWTKGGIKREIPIQTDEQRACLEEIKNLCGSQSLIPSEKKYIEQRYLYDRLTKEAGMKNLHGLRHAYAQKCYHELTAQLSGGEGWHAPFNGGKRQNALSKEEAEIDRKARLIISRVLGHSRIEICKIYLG